MRDLLADLDDAQRRAVTVEAAPLAIVAGAGSGKTRVLTRRIAYRVATGTADASHTVVLTFTRRASAELNQRLLALGLRERVVCGTLHSVAWSVLQQRWLDQGRRPHTLLERPASVLAPMLREIGSRVPVDEVAAEIDWARARMIGPDDYARVARADQRRTTMAAEDIGQIYTNYEKTKRTKRLVDFADLLSHCVSAIERDREFAEVMRWRFRHLFVDEFQDMNPLQFRLVRAWLGPRRDLCVVGDPNQSIYGWNGADHQLLERFQDHFPDATVVRLDANYRCSRPILTAAASVLPEPTELAPVIEDGPSPSVHSFANEHLEAAGIASLIREGRAPGARWSSMAVLTRTHHQLGPIERALDAARIPCVVRGRNTVTSHPATRQWLEEQTHGKRPLATAVLELEETLVDPDAAEPAGREALADLVALGRDFLAEQALGTVDGFRSWLAASQPGSSRTVDAVELSTFHAAKGLEWSTVVVAGLEQGLVPHASARSRPAKAEESRLLYVAMTRGRRQLHLTWAQQRANVDRTRSPLLNKIERTLNPGNDRPVAMPPDCWRPPSADPAPDPLRAALESWRNDVARAGRAAPRAVLPDAVLDLIAIERPHDLAALQALDGMGPLKVARYGAAVVGIVRSAPRR